MSSTVFDHVQNLFLSLVEFMDVGCVDTKGQLFISHYHDGNGVTEPEGLRNTAVKGQGLYLNFLTSILKSRE